MSPSKRIPSGSTDGKRTKRRCLTKLRAFQRHRHHFASLSRGESFTPTVGLRPLSSGGNPEIENRDLEDVVFYLKTLAPPSSASRTKNPTNPARSFLRWPNARAATRPVFRRETIIPFKLWQAN